MVMLFRFSDSGAGQLFANGIKVLFNVYILYSNKKNS